MNNEILPILVLVFIMLIGLARFSAIGTEEDFIPNALVAVLYGCVGLAAIYLLVQFIKWSWNHPISNLR